MTRARPTLVLCCLIALLGAGSVSRATSPEPEPEEPKPSRFRSPEDGEFDVSGFLDEKYGFLPVLVPITEPAVGYGAALGVAFLGQPLGAAASGHARPNVTVVGGLATANDTWAAAAGDLRYWRGGRLQTLAGLLTASVNLDFHGIGDDAALADQPLRYNLEPQGGLILAKHQLGGSRFWAGASYAFASTGVSFVLPPGAPVPPTTGDSDVGGITPSFTFDSRDNIFTPLRGAFVEASVGLFDEALGGDDEFQRVRLLGMQFFPLPDHRVYVGYRAEATASFGDVPFYLRPFVYLRGVPVLRYQGEEAAQVEAELRWQFWKRYSLLGFAGYGAAWNDFEELDDKLTAVAGGTGFRYEIARKYGIHMGLDLAFGPEDTAIYVQVGSAWARP